MEAAPAVFPDGGAGVPALVAAGEQHLEGFGEAGLAGAVAADDEGEAGAWREGQRSRGPDAAEAFDGDAPEVCARRLRCLGFLGLRARARGPRCRGSVQCGVEGVGAFAGGEDEVGPGLLAVVVGDQAVEDVVCEGVGIRPGECHPSLCRPEPAPGPARS